MIAGDCCWRRAKSLARPERSFRYHIRVLLGASTSLPSGDYLGIFFQFTGFKTWFFFLDTQLHIGREELYRHFPPPNWPYNTFHQESRKTSKNWIKCSRQQIDFKKIENKKSTMVFLWLEMLVPILVTHSPVGHYDSTTHEFQLTLSFLPTFMCAATMHN